MCVMIISLKPEMEYHRTGDYCRNTQISPCNDLTRPLFAGSRHNLLFEDGFTNKLGYKFVADPIGS